jgi:hypothetical protein
MSSGHYCDGCAQAYYKCVCNVPEQPDQEPVECQYQSLLTEDAQDLVNRLRYLHDRQIATKSIYSEAADAIEAAYSI